MNTPRTKPLVRFDRPKPIKGRPQKPPDGTYVGSLHNETFLLLIGQIMTYLPQIEERMIDVMALLMGSKSAPARQVFRAVVSEDARVKIMRALLQHSRFNRDKGQEFDEIIDLFEEVKKKRNAYAHGLWRTYSSGRAFLQEADADEFASFHFEREVVKGELEATLKRMGELWKRCLAVSHPHALDPNAKPPASPEIRPPQLPED